MQVKNTFPLVFFLSLAFVKATNGNFKDILEQKLVAERQGLSIVTTTPSICKDIFNHERRSCPRVIKEKTVLTSHVNPLLYEQYEKNDISNLSCTKKLKRSPRSFDLVSYFSSSIGSSEEHNANSDASNLSIEYNGIKDEEIAKHLMSRNYNVINSCAGINYNINDVSMIKNTDDRLAKVYENTLVSVCGGELPNLIPPSHYNDRMLANDEYESNPVTSFYFGHSNDEEEDDTCQTQYKSLDYIHQEDIFQINDIDNK